MQLIIPERQIAVPERTGQPKVRADLRVGQALQGAGQTMANIAIDLQRKTTAAEHAAIESDTINKANREYSEWYTVRSSQNTEYGTLENDSTEKANDITDTLLGDIEDEGLKGKIRLQLGNLFSRHGTVATKTARTQQIKYTAGVTEKALFTMRNTAVGTDDPIIQNMTMRQAGSLIDEQVNNGIFDFDDGEKKKIQFTSLVQEGLIRREMLNDPEGIHDQLMDEKNFPGLVPEKRTTLISQAQRIAETQERQEDARIRRKETTEKKVRDELWDNNAGILWNDLFMGELSHDKLNTWRVSRKIDPKVYDDLGKALNDQLKSGGIDNIPLVNGLMRDAYTGELTAERLLKTAGSEVTWETTSKINVIIQKGAAVVNSRDYQESLKYIEGVLGYTGIMSSLSNDKQVKLARARDELYNRVKSGENPRKVVHEMEGRYVNNLSAGLEASMYESKAAITKAFMSGTISKAVSDRQHDILDRKEALQRRKAERASTEK